MIHERKLLSFWALIAFTLFLPSAFPQLICLKPELIGIMRGAIHQHGQNPGAAATLMAKDAQRHFGGSWSVVILGPFDHLTSSFSLPSENFCESNQGGHYIAMSGFMGQTSEPTGETLPTAEYGSNSGRKNSNATSITNAEESDAETIGSKETESAKSQQKNITKQTESAALPPIVLALIVVSLIIGTANVLAICFLRKRGKRNEQTSSDVVHYATPAASTTMETYDIVDLGDKPPAVPPRSDVNGFI